MSENTIKYRQHGGYLLPELEVPDSPHIGIWGEPRRRYLREHRLWVQRMNNVRERAAEIVNAEPIFA